MSKAAEIEIIKNPSKPVDRSRLHSDLLYRVDFLKEFIGWTKDDEEALHAVAPISEPLIPAIVDAVYIHLFRYTYTKEPFLTRNAGYTGDLPSTLDELTLESEQVNFRKDFLKTWTRKLFRSDYDDPKTWEYFDKVGLMHTGDPGFKHRENRPALHVDLMACTALMAWVEDFVVGALLPLPEEKVDSETKFKAIRAFNKVCWMQIDLFQRHYVDEDAVRKGFGKKRRTRALAGDHWDWKAATVGAAEDVIAANALVSAALALSFGLALGIWIGLAGFIQPLLVLSRKIV